MNVSETKNKQNLKKFKGIAKNARRFIKAFSKELSDFYEQSGSGVLKVPDNTHIDLIKDLLHAPDIGNEYLVDEYYKGVLDIKVVPDVYIKTQYHKKWELVKTTIEDLILFYNLEDGDLIQIKTGDKIEKRVIKIKQTTVVELS